MRYFVAVLGVLALALCGTAAASTTPPATGDWTIAAGEDAVLELAGNTTVVNGSIAVAGSLFVGNGTLELANPGCTLPAQITLAGGATLRLDGAVLLATTPCEFIIRAQPGATVVVNQSSFDGLGALATTKVSRVGVVLQGANATVSGLTIANARGGIGLQGGASLSGSDLSLTVRGRAIHAADASDVSLSNLSAAGDLSSTDYLIVLEGSTLDLVGASLRTAPVAVLTLSATATFQDVDVGSVADVGVLSLSTTLFWRGGTIAPNARAAVESYGSQLDIQASFYNTTIGAVTTESTLRLSNSSFNASGANPKGAFAVVYARDSVVTVEDSAFSGRFWVTDVTRIINGTPTLVPVYGCGTSSVWSVRSSVTAVRTTTDCFDVHYQMEDSELLGGALTMVNGTEGLRLLRGSVQLTGLNGSLFASPGSAMVTLFEADGSLSDVISQGNTVGVEVSASDIEIHGLDYQYPGLGVRVVSGSPTINGSSFRIHNDSGVEVRGGSPRITNSTFTLSATTLNATGVFVQGGSPVIEADAFVGVSARVLTYGVWAWSDTTPTVRNSLFADLERGAVIYSRSFRLEGNTVERCNDGFESREGSSGVIVGNTFQDMTFVGQGKAVRIYFAATLVEGNTFFRLNYGIQLTTITTSVPGETRISGNQFSEMNLYAIEVVNSSRPVIIDNNTVTSSNRAAVYLLNAAAISSYNLFVDFPAAGYEMDLANLSIIGDRLENLSRGVDASNSNLRVDYATFSRNGVGIFSDDTPTSIHNSSFQSNSLAIEFATAGQYEVHDSLFLANGEAIMAFNSAEVDIRDSNFLQTLSFVIGCERNATASITYTRRGEITGGTVKLAGMLVSDAPFLRLSSIRFQFQPVASGIPGILVRGAGELSVDRLDFSNQTTRYSFVVQDSTGSISEIQFLGTNPDSTVGPGAPRIERSSITLGNVQAVQAQSPMTFVDSQVVAHNLTVRNANSSSLRIEGGSVRITDAAILDGSWCGVEGSAGATLAAVNATIRGHPAGSVCGDNMTADFYLSDLAGGPPDLNLTGGSAVGVWSTHVANGWQVKDNSSLTIGWRVSVTVTLANPLLLPVVNVAVSDAFGHREVSRPNGTGSVTGLPYFPERTVTASTSTSFGPYVVSATLDPLLASESIVLDRDQLVQLSLEDTLSPVITIDEPIDGAIFSYSRVAFAYTATDAGTGIRALTYRFGAGTPVTVDTQTAQHSMVRDLVDGVHTLTVFAEDFNSNQAEASVTFTVDTISPLISLNSPRVQPYLTKESSVLIQVGFDTDVVNVTIGGQQAIIFRNTANRTVSVPEGSSVVEVVATDRAGNSATQNVTVVSDRTPPPVEITNRQQLNVTIESFIVVRGTTEPGALVYVQGVPLQTTNGSFEALVLLLVGPNTIEVLARDALGNENTTSVTVNRGTEEPSTVLDVGLSVLGAALVVAGIVWLAVSLRREYVATELDRRRRRYEQGGRRP